MLKQNNFSLFIKATELRNIWFGNWQNSNKSALKDRCFEV